MAIDAIHDRLLECLASTMKAHGEGLKSPLHQNQKHVALDDEQQTRLHWLDRQLGALIAQLQGILMDIESGLSITSLGYSGDDELYEMLEDIECEVRQLQRMIREVKGLGR